MIRISIQFFGGRGARSRRGGSTGGEASYTSAAEADKGLGYGNGGEADRWASSLSPAQFDAIQTYTDEYYKNINNALRKKGKVTATFADTDKHLEEALNNYELKQPTEFTRSSTASLLGFSKMPTVSDINAMVGQIVVDEGYTSSSATNMSTAFATKNSIAYHIHTPAGKGVGAYVKGASTFPHENEFLFNKKGMYKILGGRYEYVKEPGKALLRTDLHVDLEWIGRNK